MSYVITEYEVWNTFDPEQTSYVEFNTTYGNKVRVNDDAMLLTGNGCPVGRVVQINYHPMEGGSDFLIDYAKGSLDDDGLWPLSFEEFVQHVDEDGWTTAR